MDKHYLTKTEKFWDIAELYLLLILFFAAIQTVAHLLFHSSNVQIESYITLFSWYSPVIIFFIIYSRKNIKNELSELFTVNSPMSWRRILAFVLRCFVYWEVIFFLMPFIANGYIKHFSSIVKDIFITARYNIDVVKNYTAVFSPLMIISFIFTPICEELVFRGVFYKRMRTKLEMSVLPALLISSALFTGMHIPAGLTQKLIPIPIYFLQIFFYGMCLAAVFEKTKILLPCMFLHFLYIVYSFFYIYAKAAPLARIKLIILSLAGLFLVIDITRLVVFVLKRFRKKKSSTAL